MEEEGHTRNIRKRASRLSNKLESSKFPFLSDIRDDSMEMAPDSSQLDSDPIEESTPIRSSNIIEIMSSNEMSNFRRFSARSKKQTNFFCPLDFPTSMGGGGGGGFAKAQRFSGGLRSVRRALNFDQSKLIPAAIASTASEEPSAGVQLAAIDGYSNPVSKEKFKPHVTSRRGDRSLIREPRPLLSSETVSVLSNNMHLFPVGSLVWGKLPGYDWWPGCIINYDKRNSSSLDDSNESDDDIEVVESAWVKWYGDNQLSLLSPHKLKSFDEFTKYLSPTKIKGVYKRAIFAVLKDATKRCCKDVGKSDDRKPNWIFHPSSLAPWLEKVKVADVHLKDEAPLIDDTEMKSPLYSPDSSFTDTLFTLLDSEQDSTSPVTGTKGKSRSKGGQIILSTTEKELLEWGLMGFPPTGPEGFAPKPDELNVLNEEDITQESNFDAETGRKIVLEEKSKLPLAHTRNKAHFGLVMQGQLDIEDICISCGSTNIVAQHPLFHGGLCRKCKECFMECAYLFDEDGTQMYCTVCSGGNEVFMCDTPNCSKVYCGPCIEKLCGSQERLAVQESQEWQCYMCSEVDHVGILKRREDWDHKLHELFLNDNEMDYEQPKFIPPIPAEERKPLRVLGLFDGIATGLLVLKELGFNVEVYVASEIDPDAIKVSRVHHPEIIHVGAIEYISEKEICSWGPFDLVIGGSPCNDLSIVNPARRGIYDGTGKLFFEFFRILSYAKPPPDNQRPFFWLYENVVSMRASDKQIISRFLQCNPVVVDAREISAAHRARYFWGNLPGMNRPAIPLPGDRLSLQDCLEPHCFRHAQFNKLRTITTKMNSIKQTKKAIFPVRVEGGIMTDPAAGYSIDEDVDVLWCTEMERLFGFPDHYTDIANLGRCGRQRLLGKAWSVPVVRHLLSPLKDYFQSNTTGIPSSVKNPSFHAQPQDVNTELIADTTDADTTMMTTVEPVVLITPIKIDDSITNVVINDNKVF